MNGLHERIRLRVVNILNDLRTDHKIFFSFFFLCTLLQYVTRMAHFDLVEITLCSIDSFLRTGTFYPSFFVFFFFSYILLLFIFSEIRYEKNEVLRIYVIQFMAWKWNGEKKSSEVNIGRGTTFMRNEGKIFISRGQYIFKYYAFFFSFDCFRNLNVYSRNRLTFFSLHFVALDTIKYCGRYCQKVYFC